MEGKYQTGSGSGRRVRHGASPLASLTASDNDDAKGPALGVLCQLDWASYRASARATCLGPGVRVRLIEGQRVWRLGEDEAFV